MWPFKKKRESPAEITAEAKLDQVTREVANAELTKEAAREAPFGPFEPLGMEGATDGPLHGDPDPGDEQGLRDALHHDEEKS